MQVSSLNIKLQKPKIKRTPETGKVKVKIKAKQRTVILKKG